MKSQSLNKIQVLAVDDEEKNLKLVEAILIPHNCNVLFARDGVMALEVAEKKKVDVILLDIMMPKMDGYEVCRQLKINDNLSHIPVIMVTSLNERTERIKGIAAGANDYISKPIDSEDLVLRIKNAAKQKFLHDQIKDDFEKLRELEKMRDNLTHMIIHDLRSPLSGLIGHLDLIKMSLKDKPITEKQYRFLISAIRNSKIIRDMINTLLDVNKLEENRMKLNKSNFDLKLLIKESIELVGTPTEKINLIVKESEHDLICYCDNQIIMRVLNNLLSNAYKFTSAGGEICISSSVSDKNIRIEITDTGPGISKKYHEMIFEKFGQVDLRKNRVKHSTGLGLTFCKLAVEAHGGRIGVESQPGRGSKFWFELPLQM